MEASTASAGSLQLRRSRAALRLTGDARLVTLVRAGDATAFEVVYDRHAPKLLSFCRHMLGSRDDAEDAVQRVFASAYRALLRDERAVELRPWLFAIARNECLSTLRRRRIELELGTETASTDGLSRRLEAREDLRHLLADLQNLPERQRAALLLCELGGFTHAQISAVIGMRPEQVKAHVFQARSNLIADREARARSCLEVREELASARGTSLLRRNLRRHLRLCRDCREYAHAVAEQRRELALVLPVAPTIALRSSALRAALGAAHTNGAAPGGAGLGLANAGGKALLVKGLAVAAIAGTGVGVGVGVGALRASPQHAPRTTRPADVRAARRAPAISPERAAGPAGLRSTTSARPPSLGRARGEHASAGAGAGASAPARGTQGLPSVERHGAAPMPAVRGSSPGSQRSAALQRHGSHAGAHPGVAHGRRAREATGAANTAAPHGHGAHRAARGAPSTTHRANGRGSSTGSEAPVSKRPAPPANSGENRAGGGESHGVPGGGHEKSRG